MILNTHFAGPLQLKEFNFNFSYLFEKKKKNDIQEQTYLNIQNFCPIYCNTEAKKVQNAITTQTFLYIYV